MTDLARLSGLFSSQAGLDVRAKTAAGGASTGEHPVEVYTQAIEKRRQLRELLRQSRMLIQQIE
jgi:hypothetical protein